MPQVQYSDPRSQAKKPTERQKALGQVFTPDHIASEMVFNLLAGRKDSRPVQILDPCVGPCTFPRSFVGHNLIQPEDVLVMVDLDENMVSLTKDYLLKKNLSATCRKGDYLSLPLDGTFDYAILNPPYIRQEWIEKKSEYRALFKRAYDVEVPGTSNLYAYFLVKVIKDLKPGGCFTCIIYDSWQFTKFGQWLIKFINSECSEVKCKTIGGQPFEGRLINATIMYGTKKLDQPFVNDKVENLVGLKSGYTSGIHGFVTLDDLFHTQRGLRLKQSNFFMCDIEEVAAVGATPFVKKVNSVKGFVVAPNHPEAALIIKKGESNSLMMAMLEDRVKLAANYPDENISILTWHKERPGSWHFHTPPKPAPLIFNYYMRNRPKHILNDRCYSDNFYGLTPHKGNSLAWLAILNSTVVCVEVLSHSRAQGSGLSKIQLFEYRKVNVPDIESFSEAESQMLEELGRLLLCAEGQEVKSVLARIDDILYTKFKDERLNPVNLLEILHSFQSRG